MTTLTTEPALAGPARHAVDDAIPDGPSTSKESGKHPVLSGLWTGLTSGLLALVVLLAALLIVVPKVAGGVPLTILSGSMEPNLPVGALAVVVPVDPEDVRIGEIVTYLPHEDDPTAITHRVTAITAHPDGTRTFTFQGDANSSADAPVREYQVRAKVLYAVPWLGYVNNAVNDGGSHLALYVVSGGLFVWAGTLWVGAARNRRRNATPDAADAGQRGPLIPEGTGPTAG